MEKITGEGKRCVNSVLYCNIVLIKLVLPLDPNISSLSGKAVLQGLVRSQEEYNELSKQECKELVHEFEGYKATQGAMCFNKVQN